MVKSLKDSNSTSSRITHHVLESMLSQNGPPNPGVCDLQIRNVTPRSRDKRCVLQARTPSGKKGSEPPVVKQSPFVSMLQFVKDGPWLRAHLGVSPHVIRTLLAHVKTEGTLIAATSKPQRPPGPPHQPHSVDPGPKPPVGPSHPQIFVTLRTGSSPVGDGIRGAANRTDDVLICDRTREHTPTTRPRSQVKQLCLLSDLIPTNSNKPSPHHRPTDRPTG